MANEFKIKKGLIVEGASGGTVVDVQGSQGQLFSVTDDLSGSIFAVSDISGVPILDVNSSGVVNIDGNLIGSSTAYFSGAITTNLSSEGTYFTGGSGSIRQLSITSGTNISANALHTFNIASSNGKYEFDVDGTTELSLDSSNATFAGDIIGGGSITVGSSGGYNAGVIYSDANWGMIFRALQADPNLADFMFANSEDVERLRITSTGATFAGDVTASNFYGLAQDLAVTSNDTFNGTYGLLWHDGADVYSSTWMTVNGSNDTLTVPTIAADLNGTINTATTGVTQTADDNSTKIATTAYADAAAAAVPIGNYLPLTAGDSYPLTGTLYGTSTNFSGNGSYAGSMNLGVGASTAEAYLTIGQGRTDSGFSYIDLVGGITYPDYGLRIIRGNTGANAGAGIYHRGTGNLEIQATDSASMLLRTNNTTALTLTNTQNAIFTGNVGIGTTSPSEKLEVSGKVRIFDGGYPYIDLGVSTSNYFRIIHDNPNDILKIGKNGATTSSSLIVQGGTGNVGIGGVPGSRFDIQGTQGQLFSVTDDLSGDIFSVADISGVPIMNVNSDGTSYFDGNVGIGTDSPGAKLHVNGHIKTSVAADNFAFEVENATEPGFKYRIYNDGSSPVNSNTFTTGLYHNTTENAAVHFYRGGSSIGGFMTFTTYNGSERMRIASNGNVGIGATSPGKKLQIDSTSAGEYDGANSSNAGGTHLLLKSSGDTTRTLMSGPSIVFATPANADGTNIWATSRLLGSPSVYGSARGTFSIQVRDQYDPLGDGTSWNWRTALTAVSDGNVGIGTTSPGAKLTVKGSNSVNAFKITDSGDGDGLKITSHTTQGTYAQFYDASHTQTIMLDARTDNSSRHTYFNGGNVGIGTTSPGSKLEVTGDTASALLTLKSETGVDNDAFMRFYDEAGGGSYSVGLDSTDQKFKIAHENDGDSLTTGTKLVIDTSGNVGIGTTSPVASYDKTLHIKAANPTVRIETDNDNGWAYTQYVSPQGSWSAGIDEAERYTITKHTTLGSGHSKFLIDTNGNVGIGTTSPNAKLDIHYYTSGGNDDLLNIGLDANNPTRAKIYTENYDGNFGLWNSGSTQQVKVSSDGNSYFNGGNVGIGTTTFPTTDIGERELLVQGAIVSKPPGVDDYYSYLKSNWALDGAFELGIQGADVNHKFITSSNYYHGTHLNLWTSDQKRLVIDDVGNVGIGTTSPGDKLDISGTVRANQFRSLTGTYTGDSHTNKWQKVVAINYSAYSFDAFKLVVNCGGDPSNLNINAEVYINFKFQNNNGRVYANIVNYGDTPLLSDNFEIYRNGTNGLVTIYQKITRNYQTPSWTLIGSPVNSTYTWSGSVVGTDLSGETNDAWTAKTITNGISTNAISGNVGIGTTSPDYKLHVNGSFKGGGIIAESATGVFSYNEFPVLYGYLNAYSVPALGEGSMVNSGIVSYLPTGEAMRIDNSGNVGIGTDSPGQMLDVDGNIECSSLYLNNASSLYFLPTYFGQRIKANCQGLLVQNGSTYQAVYASAFSVQSDYRLKSNVIPLDNAIDRLKQMSVHRFNWNDRLDEPKVDGFIAHELSQVVPEAVLGEKDATKEDGTPDYQGIDQSKIVPLLTAALQDAITKIEQLETRIQTLENND